MHFSEVAAPGSARQREAARWSVPRSTALSDCIDTGVLASAPCMAPVARVCCPAVCHWQRAVHHLLDDRPCQATKAGRKAGVCRAGRRQAADTHSSRRSHERLPAGASASRSVCWPGHPLLVSSNRMLCTPSQWHPTVAASRAPCMDQSCPACVRGPTHTYTHNSLCLLVLLLLLLLPDLLHLPPGYHPCVGQCADQRQPRQGGRLLHTHSQGEQGQGVTGRGHFCWSLSRGPPQNFSTGRGGRQVLENPCPPFKVWMLSPGNPSARSVVGCTGGPPAQQLLHLSPPPPPRP